MSSLVPAALPNSNTSPPPCDLVAQDVFRFVARQDLVVSPRNGLWGVEWIVKDPIAVEYFLIQADEMRVLEALQTPKTIGELHRHLHDRPGLPLTKAELSNYVSKLCADNLATSVDGRNGERLNRQADILGRRKIFAAIGGILAIKVPGFSGNHLLKGLDWLGSLLFHPVALIGFIVGLLLMLAWTAMSFSTFVGQIPAASWFATPQNLLLLFLGYLGVKACHEIGHGLACRYYGGQVREMGLLFLFFSPCLYCDATDAWMIPNKFRRMMISLAGVYVEMLFSLAFFWAWWFSSDYETSAWLFGMMLTTSASTLLVNGNPLLKFDGYFALADWWEIPNLSNVSQQHLNSCARSIFFSEPESLETAWQTKLVAYALTSTLYRWLMMFGILTAGYWILRANGLEMLGIGASVLLTLIVLGGTMLKTAMATLVVATKPNKRWTAWLATFIAMLCVGLWFVAFPIERRVRGTAVLELSQPERVYAARSGLLHPQKLVGDTIAAGVVIATIDDPYGQQRLVELKHEIEVGRLQIESRRLNREVSLETSGEIEFLETKLQRLRSELEYLQREHDTRNVVALQAGVLFPPLESRSVGAKPEMTPDYHFAPSKLSKNSHLARVEKGELLGLVGVPHRLVATVLISPYEQQAIRPGQTSKLLLNYNGAVIRAKVQSLELPETTPANNKDTNSISEERVAWKVVLELLDDSHSELRPGMTMPCLIEVERTTPLAWLQLSLRRWILRTF